MSDVIMPKIAESIFEGTITKWLKKPGDEVKQDEPLFEISTDKVDTEIPSPATGFLNKIVHNEGETVPINTVVAVIGESKDTSVPSAPKKAKKEEKKEDRVEATRISASGSQSSPAMGREKAPSGDGKVKATPVVRKMAKEKGVELSAVRGTGPGGRITKEDLLNHLETNVGAKTAEPVAAGETQTRSLQSTIPLQGDGQELPYPLIITGPVREEKMTPMRKKIAEHMVISRRTSAHVTTCFEVNMDEVVRLREKEKGYFEKVHNTPLTYTSFFATAVIQSIREFPYLNSSVDGDKIITKKYINLGIAVALPDGLIVPVIKDADEKSFVRISRDIADLAARARARRLSLDEVKGGTFTITNPGIYGGEWGTPIINQPEVAIMGVGGIHKKPVVKNNDSIGISSMCYLTLSFDHRIIDGAYADQFMAKVKEFLENWNIPIK